MQKMKIVSIIPSRCGSKGIPNKNIYQINNKPLISYCLESLKLSSVPEYYVSTDCEQIAEVSMQYGAKIINRPPEISTDTSPTIDCIKHAINYIKLERDDIILIIQPTSPLILFSDINNILNKMLSNKYTSVITVTPDHSFLWEKQNDYVIPKHHDPYNRIRRQDMTPTFKENGSIYATTVNNILKTNSIYGSSKIGYVEIPKSRSFEIDDYEDIKIIEALL